MRNARGGSNAPRASRIVSSFTGQAIRGRGLYEFSFGILRMCAVLERPGCIMANQRDRIEDLARIDAELFTLLLKRLRMIEQLQRSSLDSHDWTGLTPQERITVHHALNDLLHGPRDLTRSISQLLLAGANRDMPKSTCSSAPRLLVSKASRPEPSVVWVKAVGIGLPHPPVLIAGPCAIESRDQLRCIAAKVKSLGKRSLLRGGAFKPRTSPYSFAGLGLEGLLYLSEVSAEFDIPTVTEVLSPSDVEIVAEHSDMLQIGSRSMYNYPLLKEVGKIDKPILLKRSMMATVEEWLFSAEYIYREGNPNIVLCERGIRTFERCTRNTMDVSAILVVKQSSHLPIIADPSHAAGRRDIVVPLARACLAAGADGIMVEAHFCPETALSDGPQSLDFDQLDDLARDFT
jgi:3-deoxy-7-phosphoheptulonate synthase